MDVIQVIEEKIRDTLSVVDVIIIDESIKHNDHYLPLPSMLPSHIKLILISNDFVGMSILKRHKMIYRLLKSEMEQMHAVSLHLYTQNEYNLKN